MTTPLRLVLKESGVALTVLVAMLVLGVVHPTPARAVSAERQAKINRAAWKAECSACHMAYPAALMPRRSWQRIMRTLARHFGTNADLDAPTRRAITTYLMHHAADAKRARGGARDAGNASITPAIAPARITEFTWFKVDHGTQGGDDNRYRSPKAMSDCVACHRGALRGVFSRDG